jgi:AcrR family transcriptional regulator
MMSPPRARILADGSADLRAHLIEVTERLLAEGGLEGLTTRRIARTAGVADGVLYNHFTGKDDLILAGLLARAVALMEQFENACPQPGSGTLENNLGQLAQALVTIQRALLPLLAGLIGKRALLGRFVAELHSPAVGGPDRILSAIHEHLDAERRLGRVRPDAETHVVGILLFAITQLQALVTQVQAPDTPLAAAPQTLTPFIAFLADGLTETRDWRP